ncbi:MAG: hypothetical protein JWO06_2791 [Bacteroidota bacterium]|nr:hypothetical protein [Bacteroidota bacterium]
MKKGPLLLVISLVLALTVSEVTLRVTGHRPYSVEDISDSIVGHGLVIDPILGFSLNPGDVWIDFEHTLKSHAHHCDDKSRATGPVCTKLKDDSLPNSIFLYGCSFTYGSNLDDSMTMAWKIKENLPDRNVKNFGVGGYGMSHVYLEILKQEKDGTLPGIIIINYANMHDMRTVFSRTWRKLIVPNYKANIKNEERLKMVPIDSIQWPYYRMDANGNPELKYVKLTESYTEWPLIRHSALMNLLENTYNKYTDKGLQMGEVTFKLFSQLNDLCKKHNTKLIIAGLYHDDDTKKMLQRCSDIGIATHQYQIELSDSKYTLEPLDTHPNSLGNTMMAKEMLAFLKSKNW